MFASLTEVTQLGDCMNIDIDRFDSPTGSMVPSLQGRYVKYEDAIAMAYKSSNIHDHLAKHEHYKRRAEGIIAVYRGQHAVAHYMTFYDFADLRDDNTVGLNIRGMLYGKVEVRDIYVPAKLFESTDESLVVAAARRFKDQELVRIEQDRKAQEATKEAAERAELRRLMATYPDELTQPTAPDTQSVLKIPSKHYEIEINVSQLRGFFEHKEFGDDHGGTLLFDPKPGKLGVLVDADGTHVLPKEVAAELRASGFEVPPEFD